MWYALRLTQPLLSREILTNAGNAFGFYAGVYFIYVAAAGICLGIYATNTFAALIWAPIAIALVVFTIYGYRFALPIALAAFTVNYYLGAGPITAMFIAAGNTAAPLLGAHVLEKYIDLQPPRLRLRDATGIIFIAFFISLISASVGVASLWLSGSITASMTGGTWLTWWLGDTLGVLIFAPLLFKWLFLPHHKRTRFEYLEISAAMAATAGVAILVFWTPHFSYSYYLFIPLTWAALRTGPRGTSLAIFLGSAIAIGGSIAGSGPFAGHAPVNLQLFIGNLALLYLIFSTIVEERSYALQKSEVHVHELEHALRRISSEDEAKKEFLAVLAHELRNPLASVLSSVELLKLGGAQMGAMPAQLKSIGEHVRGMASLLDDLLDISRISKRKFKLHKEVVVLCNTVDRALMTAQASLHARGHSLSLTKPPEKIYIEADPNRLEQIFVNLLSNAAKYTEPNGSVSVVISREGDYGVVRIRDTGIGIPSNMLTRIFDPFFQLDRGKAQDEGLGIGLALTRQFVEMHGGTIEAHSPGKDLGSEFIVRLPSVVAPPERRRGSVPKNRDVRRSEHSLRILVVDDNRDAADALGKLLMLRGHDTQIAYAALEAIEKSIEFEPHVVILDIGLPDLDGYEVARRLRKKNYGGTIIALTGYGQESDKERAKQAGFSFHLTKPVGLKEIEAVLHKISLDRSASPLLHPPPATLKLLAD